MFVSNRQFISPGGAPLQQYDPYSTWRLAAKSVIAERKAAKPKPKATASPQPPVPPAVDIPRRPPPDPPKRQASPEQRTKTGTSGPRKGSLEEQIVNSGKKRRGEI